MRITNQIRQSVINVQQNNKNMTLHELAEMFGISHTTIHRILAEAGIRKSSYYKSTEQGEMINYLEERSITTLGQLKQHI